MLVTPLNAHVAHFVFLRDVWILTKRTAVASRGSTNLATHLAKVSNQYPYLATHFPYLYFV